MTPWPEFRNLKPAQLVANMAGRTIIDPYRVLEEAVVLDAGLDYITLGSPGKFAVAKAKTNGCL
jgi:hypothetical protein